MSKLVLNIKYLLLLTFLTLARFYNLGHIQGGLTQKKSALVICTTFRHNICVGWKKQTFKLNLSFDALSQWHETDITLCSSILHNNFPQGITILWCFLLKLTKQVDIIIPLKSLPRFTMPEDSIFTMDWTKDWTYPVVKKLL